MSIHLRLSGAQTGSLGQINRGDLLSLKELPPSRQCRHIQIHVIMYFLVIDNHLVISISFYRLTLQFSVEPQYVCLMVSGMTVTSLPCIASGPRLFPGIGGQSNFISPTMLW